MTTTRIAHLRQQQGWTQERLAEAAGVGIRTIQRLEAGQDASLETLSLVAEALRVPVRELFAEDDAVQAPTLDERAEEYDRRRAEQQSARHRIRGAWVWLYVGIGVVVTVIPMLTGVPFWLGVAIAYWAGGLILLRVLIALVLEPWLDRRYPLSRSRRRSA
jgi:transcriptional regulator with XRE-family HTH domain